MLDFATAGDEDAASHVPQHDLHTVGVARVHVAYFLHLADNPDLHLAVPVSKSNVALMQIATDVDTVEDDLHVGRLPQQAIAEGHELLGQLPLLDAIPL